MAFERHSERPFPGVAATNIAARVAVKLDPSGQRQVAPVGSAGENSLGFTHVGASPGFGIAVHEANSVVKAIAGASLGNTAEVMIGSTNGALIPAAAASGSPRFAVGQALEAAQPGDVFSLYVRPRQISGLV